MSLSQISPEASQLGKISEYDAHYNPDKLFAIPRKLKRDEIGISNLPFYGVDIWTHYEVSWLNNKGKPMCAMAEIRYDCTSTHIIESKSMKLYFNSLNNTKFTHSDEVISIIERDLTQRVGGDVFVKLYMMHEVKDILVEPFKGICLDDLDVSCSSYEPNPSLLTTEAQEVNEVVYSDLLKSNCLVTHQPDWASIQIAYCGQKINHAGLLQYLVSFRNHNEFHEQCIERIFVDLLEYCKPQQLTIYGRYTRRGGIEINSFRTTTKNFASPPNIRLPRQ